MKTSFLVIMAICASMTIASCAKEEVEPAVPAEPPIDYTVQKHRTQNINVKNGPEAVAEISPCGRGFVFNISYMGNPANGEYKYAILIPETETIVDAGMISDGEHTGDVLNTCTEYEVRFYGSTNPNIYSKRIYTTDGCNGVFKC